jgi:hypothetical protein
VSVPVDRILADRALARKLAAEKTYEAVGLRHEEAALFQGAQIMIEKLEAENQRLRDQLEQLSS